MISQAKPPQASKRAAALLVLGLLAAACSAATFIAFIPSLLIAAIAVPIIGNVWSFVLDRRGARRRKTGHDLRLADVPPRVARAALAGAGLAAVALVLGGGFGTESAEMRNGQRVATVHGAVVRRLSKAEYDRLRGQDFRFALFICAVLGCATAALVSASDVQMTRAQTARRPGPAPAN